MRSCLKTKNKKRAGDVDQYFAWHAGGTRFGSPGLKIKYTKLAHFFETGSHLALTSLGTSI